MRSFAFRFEASRHEDALRALEDAGFAVRASPSLSASHEILSVLAAAADQSRLEALTHQFGGELLGSGSINSEIDHKVRDN
jgi:hypothetical protein